MAATLTIANTVPGYKFQPYQIFSGTAAGATSGNNPIQLNDVQWGEAIPEASRTSFISDLISEGIIANGTYSSAADVAVAIHDANIGDDSTKAQKLAEVAKKYATVAAANEVEVAAGDTTAVFNNLDDGYYLIVNTAKAADETTDNGKKVYEFSDLMMEIVGNATVNSKASDTPVVEKKIDTGATAGQIDSTDVDENTASIGDIVPYVIEGNLPQTYARYKTYYYEFSDTLSDGLTYVSADDASTTDVVEHALKVFIQNGTADPVDITSKVTGTVGAITINGQNISVKFNNLKAFDADDNDITIDANTKFIVKYYAKVNTSAVIDGPNPNTVKLIFSNDPNKGGSGEPGTPDNPTGESPEDKVETYVTDLRIYKTDGTKKLTGAKFTITGEGVKTVVTTGTRFTEDDDANPAFYKLSDGSFTQTAPTEDTRSKYDTTDYGKKFKKEAFTDEAITKGASTTVTGFVGEDGKLNFKGLNAGVYTITEDVAPNGYNRIDPFYVKISFDSTNKTWKAEACTAEGVVYQESDTEHHHVYNQGTDKVIEITVVNHSGTELPSTGGMGTTILYIGGSILVLAAAILLITKRRMSSED